MKNGLGYQGNGHKKMRKGQMGFIELLLEKTKGLPVETVLREVVEKDRLKKDKAWSYLAETLANLVKEVQPKSQSKEKPSLYYKLKYEPAKFAYWFEVHECTFSEATLVLAGIEPSPGNEQQDMRLIESSSELSDGLKRPG